MPSSTDTHGGRRPGAGRPLEGDEPTRTATLSLPASWLAAIERHARAHGLSRSAAARAVLQLRRGVR